jgi:hypothetical protein
MDQFNLLDPVVRELRALGPSRWGVVSAKCGVPEGTIYRIAYGRSQNPGVLNVQAIARVLLKNKR